MRLAMSSFSVFVVFLTVGSAVTVYGEENCNMTSKVSLSLVGNKDICPSQPVTLRCVVKIPSNQQSPFLAWRCSGSVNENLVICDPILNFNCEFGKVVNVTGSCKCEDTVIVSEATYFPNPDSAGNLTCGNGAQEETVSLSVKALSTPQLNCTTVDMDNNVQYEVRVWWIVNDTDTYNDVEYVVSVVNSSSPTPMDITTNQTQITIDLFYGVNYTIAVIAQRCGGNVTSQSSKECPLYNPEKSTVTVPAPTATPMPPSRGSSNGEQLVGALVGGLLAVTSLLIFAIGLFLCCRYKFSAKVYKYITDIFRQQTEAVDSPLQAEGDLAWNKFEVLKNLDGVEASQSERYTRIIEEESQKRTGVGGIYVDGEFIYYSCIEQKDGTDYFILRKCEHNGTFVCGVTCPDFIRGIGIDIDGFIYVLCSASKSKVIKFDRELSPLRITHTNYFGESFGMLVTSAHVFVTSKRYDRLCVLDLNLNHHFNLKLSQGPFGITALDENKYIVTFKAAIGVIDINFDEKKYRETKVECMRMKNGNNETFKAGPILRGICVSNQYILVTEVWDLDLGDGRLLCLEYNEKSGQLKMVAAQDNFSNNCSQLCTKRRNEYGKKCNAIVVTSYNGAIYYSQGSHSERFHIVRAIVNGTSIDSNKLFDVPSN